VARRLEFEQDESSLQETPALSGSGQRRGKRADVYDIPEDGSPAPQTSAILEEIFEEDEITADGDSVVIDGTAEESFIAQIGDDTTIGPAAVEDVLDMEESEVMLELVKEPAKRGRKRKSDVLEPAQGDSTTAAKSRKRGATSAQVSDGVKKGKRVAPAPNVPYRRSKRVSDINELESSAIDISADAIAEADEAPVAPKRRGRPPRAESQANKENAASTKASKPTVVKDKEEHVFKKPPKPATRPKEVKNKASVDAAPTIPQIDGAGGGKLVDVTGKPLSKKDIEQMSTTTVGSRYGRGRHLSVFRELEPEAVARIGRTGRHRVAPIDFWKNDRISYDTDGSMTSVVKNQDVDSPRKQYKSAAKPKGKKRSLTAIEEEEGELEPWEEEDGMLKGNYRDYDPVTDVISNVLLEASKLLLSTTLSFDHFLIMSQQSRGLRRV
jgi:centromere protein C